MPHTPQGLTEGASIAGAERMTMGSDGRVSMASQEGAEEQLAAEAVDRTIANLDTATATVEAQMAELRRMRRAA